LSELGGRAADLRDEFMKGVVVHCSPHTQSPARRPPKLHSRKSISEANARPPFVSGAPLLAVRLHQSGQKSLMRFLTIIRRVPGEKTFVLQCRPCGLSTAKTVDGAGPGDATHSRHAHLHSSRPLNNNSSTRSSRTRRISDALLSRRSAALQPPCGPRTALVTNMMPTASLLGVGTLITMGASRRS
jgi:hypothetical protein